MNKYLALLRFFKCLAFFLPIIANALTCTALTGSVNWTTAVSWTSVGNCNRVPTAADDVIIPSGSTVTLTAASSISNLTVQDGGDLIFTAIGSPMPTVSGTKTFGANSTVEYNANGNQNVSAETYGNLSFRRTTGNRVRTPNAGTFTIQGDFTINTRTTWAANTNNPTVNLSGNLTVAGTLTSGTGTFTFNGSGTQTISAAVTITNVVVSNSSAQGLSLTATHTFTNLTLSPNSVLSLAGTTTAFPTNTTRSLNATSTVQFVGSGNQTIPAYTYGNLVTGTGGTKTPSAGTHTVSGDLSIGVSTTYAANTNNPTINVSGNLNIDGSMNAGTGAISIGTNLNINSGSTLTLPRITGGNAMPTVSGTKTFDAASTVNYSGAGAQIIVLSDYGTLTVSGSGNKTPEAGTFNIAGNFNVMAGTWLGSTNNPNINIAGNMTRAGTFTSGSGVYDFNGTGAQTLNAICTFTNLTVENLSSNGLTSSAAQTVTNLILATNAVMKNTANLTLTNLTMDAGAGLFMQGTTSALTVSGTDTIDSTSTVSISGTGNQTFPALSYGNLSLSSGGSKTAGTANGQTIDITGSFSLGTGTTYAGTTRNPTVNIAGNFSKSGTFNSGTGLYTFNGTTGQLLSGNPTTFSGSMTVSNSTSTGLTIEPAVTVTGTLTLNASAVMTLGDGTIATTAMPTAGTKSFNATSTVVYDGTSGAQTVAQGNYGNLILSGGGTKTLATGTFDITGNFSLGSSTTYQGTTNNPTINLAGDFSNSGTFNSGSGTFTMNGNSAQSLTGATTISSLRINNSAAAPNQTLTINNDLTVSTTLTFSAGNMVTGANKVVISSGASIVGAGSATGWVAGNLQKFVSAGTSSPVFEVGTNGSSAPSLAYSPINAAFTGVSAGGGNVVASAISSDHPQVNSSGLDVGKNVNRWWSLLTSGVSGTPLPVFTNLNIILNFLASDLDVGVSTSNLFVSKYNGATWNSLMTGTRTSTSTQATGLTTIGEFALGQPSPPSVTLLSMTISDPANGTTNPKAIPGAIKQFIIAVTNTGLDMNSDSCIISSPIDNRTALYVDDINGASSGPLRFIQGAPSSGLSYTFSSLSSNSDDIDFSSDNGATWSYVPTVGPDGCDPSVTNIRINPKGIFAAGTSLSPQPSFQVEFHSCVK